MPLLAIADQCTFKLLSRKLLFSKLKGTQFLDGSVSVSDTSTLSFGVAGTLKAAVTDET